MLVAAVAIAAGLATGFGILVASRQDAFPTDGTLVPGLMPQSVCEGEDAAPAIEEFIAESEDVSTIWFPPEATCSIDGSLDLSSRDGVTYDLEGAVLERTSAPACEVRRTCDVALVLLEGVQDVTLRNGTLLGGMVRGDEPEYDPSRSKYHAVQIRSSVGVTLEELVIRDHYADCVDVDGTQVDGPSREVVIRDVQCDGAGRQGISAGHVDGLLIERVDFDWIARSAVDLEPGGNKAIRNVTIRDSTFHWVTNFVLAGVGGSPIWENVTLEDNVMLGCSEMRSEGGCYGKGFVFVGNSFERGPLTVTGNQVINASTVKHTSGSFADNTLVQNPKGQTCLVKVIESEDFEVTGNDAPGLQEFCAFSRPG